MDRNLRIRMLLEAGDKVSRPLRDIAGGSSKAAQALRVTRDRLKEIERAQADIAGFRALKTGLRSAGAELDAARARVTALGREISETEAPSRKLTRAFEQAKREARALEQQHQQNSARLVDLREKLAAAGVPTSELVRHERRLREEAARTNQELTEQGRRLTQLNDRSRRLGIARDNFSRTQGTAAGLAAGGAAAIGTGIALGAPILRSVQGAQEYQSRMTDIAQKADMSRDAAGVMGKRLLVAARAANQMPQDIQAGVDNLTGLGASVPDAEKMMTPIARAATAYKAANADLASAAYAAKDNLKVPAEQTAKAIDIMAFAGKRGAFEVKDMAGQFPELTAAYQALGQSGTRAVADLAAGAQIARKGAGSNAAAGTNLINLLNKINTKEATDNFKKFGVDLPASLKRAAAAGKGPIEAISELTNKALKGDMSKMSYLFGDAQVQAALRPLIANLGEFKKIRDDALNASGTVDADFAERLNDSAEKAKRAAVNAQVLSITLGGMLMPAWDKVTGKAGEFAHLVGNIAQRYPNVTKAVAIGAAGFAALFVVLGGGALVIAGLVAPFAALSFAAGALGIGLLPVIGIALGVVAGITAIGAAAYLVYANWGAITGFFGQVWDTVKSATLGALAFFVHLPARFAEFGRNMIAGMIRGILGMLGNLKSTIVGAASSAADWFKRKLGIHSPSRVFAGFGGFMMQGLTAGIGAREAEPVRRIDALSRQLTAAMAIGAVTTATPAIAEPGPSPQIAAARARMDGRDRTRAPNQSAPAGPAAPIVINVYGAPGQSPQELARAMRAELEKIRREEAAARLGRFADQQDWTDL